MNWLDTAVRSGVAIDAQAKGTTAYSAVLASTSFSVSLKTDVYAARGCQKSERKCRTWPTIAVVTDDASANTRHVNIAGYFRRCRRLFELAPVEWLFVRHRL